MRNDDYEHIAEYIQCTDQALFLPVVFFATDDYHEVLRRLVNSDYKLACT